jgi:hypothetical protein
MVPPPDDKKRGEAADFAEEEAAVQRLVSYVQPATGGK